MPIEYEQVDAAESAPIPAKLIKKTKNWWWDELQVQVQVTAAIIQHEGKYLICQRAHDDELPLMWEFPGGKLEPGETLEDCIIRECQEELGVDIRVCGQFGRTSYPYKQWELVFTFFQAEIVAGTLTLAVHEQIRWVSAAELKGYVFCPADVEIVEQLAGGGAAT